MRRNIAHGLSRGFAFRTVVAGGGHRMIEPLHRRVAGSASDVDSGELPPPPPTSNDRDETFEKESSFPVKFRDPAMQHGLSGDARRMLAEVDEEYENFEDHYKVMQQRQEHGVDAMAGEDGDEGVRRIAAPFMEKMVPSFEEGRAFRGMEGELSIPQDKEFQHDRHSEHCRRTENKLLELVESSLPHEEKTDQVLQLMSGAMSSGVYLQAGTYEDVTTLLMMTPYFAGGETPFPHTQILLEIFRYMKSTFTAPTATILEHCMVALARQPGEDEATLHSATRLLLDADKYIILPSRVAITAYFDVCCTNQAMDLAITRYADVTKNLGITPDSGMVTALISGMNKQGMIEEAIAFSSHIEHVRIDTPMMNAMLETFMLSSDPEATFAGYKALAGSTDVCLPDSNTFTTLLLACEALDDWYHVKMVLHEMQRLRVRGDPETLNMLLRGLLKADLEQYAEQLYLSMVDKEVKIWPELERAMPENIRTSGDSIRKASNIIGHLKMAAEEEELTAADDVDADSDMQNEPLSEHTIGTPLTKSVTQNATNMEAADDDAELEALLSIEPTAKAAKAQEAMANEAPSEHELAQPIETARDELNPTPKKKKLVAPLQQKTKMIPKSIHHLKQLAAKRKLHDVDTEYLQSYLVNIGAVKQSRIDSITSKTKLVAMVHKEIFGVLPAYESGSIVGGDMGARRRSDSRRGGFNPKKEAALKRRSRHRGRDDF